VKVTDRYDNAAGTSSLVSYSQNSINSFQSGVGVAYIKTSSGVSTSIEVNRFYGSIGSGSTIILPPAVGVDLPTPTAVNVGNLIQTVIGSGTTSIVLQETTVTGFSTTLVNGLLQTTILVQNAAAGVGTNVQFVVKNAPAKKINTPRKMA
jgi:hypothetical protein